MLTFYIVSAVVGGFLVVLSALGAGHDADVDHDLDLSHDTEVSVDHGDHAGGDGAWIPFLSLRFWTYFFAAFGLTGILLSKLAAVPEPLAAWVSAGTGFVCGLAVTFVMRLVRQQEADSSAKIDDILGTVARVLVPVHGDQPGKIRFMVKGETIELLALNQETGTIQSGEDVVIVAIEKDRARVLPRGAVFD
ncbi:MAG TPA: hypothetical protein VM328_04865 [Fimbriimonadaceae bacterium]|nr:hypothetical protein [Fimbriimonadaceae bacterium]